MIYYKEGYLYQTTRMWIYDTGIIPPKPVFLRYYTLNMEGRLVLDVGFAWDGATWCPEWLVTPEMSAPHDAFCQLMRANILPYDTYAPQVHGLLGKMVAERWGSFVGAGVRNAVTLAKGGHPSNADDNPELTDPKQENKNGN